jgi:hypothetical protein
MNFIGDAGIEHLVNGRWNKLVNINFHSNKITFFGAYRLVKAEWPNLKSI